jgi:hypothetical protein
MTGQFTPATKCAITCSGKPEDCGFGEAVDRLARLPELTPDEIAVERQIGEWCLLVSDGIRTAHEISAIVADNE